MGSNYDFLIAKINEFTRKFYLNKLLRGSIYAIASILAFYLLIFVFIYYTRPAIEIKTILFFAFILWALVAISYWVIKPGLAYFKLSKNLSLEQAAVLIGDHFFLVKDKLLNTLQLKDLAKNHPQQEALILAGIDQKIEALKPIPFSSAINLRNNSKQVKYILIPLSIIFLIGLIAPAILREGTNSFIRYSEEVLPEAPFHFVILNKHLNVVQGDDLTVELALKGNEFPQDVYLKEGSNTYKLEKKDINHFSYTYKNIQQNKSLRFFGGGFNSASFVISVKPRPALHQMQAMLVYPSYLGRKNEELNPVGDLLVPEGTKITWTLKTANSTMLSFILSQKAYRLRVQDNLATFSTVLKQSGTYQVIPQNDFVNLADSLSHQITVIADQFPSIAVTESNDSLSRKALYFSGSISDDHGFSSLKFKYNLVGEGQQPNEKSIVIPIEGSGSEQAFFYLWDLNKVDVKPGQSLNYYFEIMDNDGVNGPKITRSEFKTFRMLTQKEIAAQLVAGSETLKQKMETAIKLAADIERESKKLSQQLLDKKQLSFEDKKQIEQLLSKQQQLEEAVKDIKKQNEKNNFEKAENNILNEELMEKQKQIDDLFNHVLDDQTKMLLQKLQELMGLNNRDKTREELSKMQMDNKTLKNELDRILELYKQLEFEQNLKHQIDRLNEMANQQRDLSEQSKDQKTDLNTLKKQQDELNKAFKALQKDLQSLAEKNEALAQPNPFQNPKEETSKIEQQQASSSESLSKNDKQQATEKQKQAAEEMQQLAKQLEESQQEGEEEGAKINALELRRLLENLLRTSFEQEKVMLTLRKASENDPAYVANAQQQSMIKENMKTIADSLFALSKRVPQIESTVNTELEKINFNIGKAIENLGDRRTAEANRYQQFAMTSLNNLALMLNEALDQLQKSAKGGGKGKGQKQSIQQLQKMQDQLNQNMQKAREKMEREGNKGVVPKGEMSQEFVRMAQQQQLIREALQKINREENKDGKGTLGDLNQTIKEMKQTETDLVNKRIALETMKRQQRLLVKLLDAERAQREQDEDAQRQSNAGKQFPPSYQQMLEKFKREQRSESESIQKLPPTLNDYYKSKIAEYFKLLNLKP